jgi:hypothetical protein
MRNLETLGWDAQLDAAGGARRPLDHVGAFEAKIMWWAA